MSSPENNLKEMVTFRLDPQTWNGPLEIQEHSNQRKRLWLE